MTDPIPNPPGPGLRPPATQPELDSMSFGVAVVGPDQVLIRANQAFGRLLDLPPALARAGVGLRDILDFVGRFSDFGDETADPLQWIQTPTLRQQEWVLPGGRSVAVECRVLADQRILTFQDVSALAIARERIRGLESSLVRENQTRVQLETEWRASEAQLHHAQKMETVGHLSGGMAHDFNNLLTVIMGSLEFMESMLPDDHPCRRLISEAESAASRGAELTHRMLAFSRTQALQPKVVNLGTIIQNLRGLIERTLGEAFQIETRILTTVLLSRVDPGQLENCLLNLCLNSRDAMPQGGRLVIAVERPDGAASGPGEPDSAQVLLSVSDDGVGMSPEVLERAIDPFFTTKEVNRGSGLGLSMVYGFVKQSGGQFRIESEVGVGTRVLFTVPQWKGALPVESIADERAARELTGRKRVLLTEDSPEVRDVVQEMLHRLGHDVMVADTHKTALEALADAAKIDLLLTDIVLPGGKNGYQLANAALREQPDLRVLFMSGYQRRKTFRDSPMDRFPMLQKPFQQNELAEAVLDALQTPVETRSTNKP